MRKYKIEVDITATAYLEIEANSEEEAYVEANKEVGDMTVNQLKSWDETQTIKSVTEQCENCCEEVDVDDCVPVREYRGVKLCDSCIDWAKKEPKDFELIFKHKVKD